jgi:hypothetical protein
MTRTDACKVLGIDPHATFSQGKARFRVLANRYHPDRYLTPAEKAVATRRFQHIADAYDVFVKSAEPPSRAASPPEATSSPGLEPDPPESVSGWDLFDPLLKRYPFSETIVGTVMLPSIIVMAFLRYPAMRLQWAIEERWPRVTHSLFWLSTHILPGIGALALGLRGEFGDTWWQEFSRAWFILGGTVTITVDLIAQILGIVRILRGPKAPSLSLILAK